MARRKKRQWQTRYQNELRNARRRAQNLRKLGVGFDFPETAPRNAREAERRIKQLQQLRVSNIANRALPKGAYGITTYDNPFTNTVQNNRFGINEIYRLSILEQQANLQRRRYGLEPNDYAANRSFQTPSAMRKYIEGLRRQGSSTFQANRQSTYVENYISGLQSAIDVLVEREDIILLNNVIERINDLGVQRASQMLLDAERMGVSIHTLVFGSDQYVIKANLGIIAEFWLGTPYRD